LVQISSLQKSVTEFTPGFGKKKNSFLTDSQNQPDFIGGLVMVLNPTQNWFDIALV